MSDKSAIRSVADTALWIATVRAAEGERADAVFRDPLGSMLAGERGREIARSFSRSAMVAWGVVARTSAIDRLINDALQSGADTVLNLGAGLDMRPYRMELPSHIHWIEIDFPAIVEAKNSGLIGYQPVCRLERHAMDLLNRPARIAMVAHYAATAKNMLVITEGVIPYFSNEDVSTLAKDLYAVPSIGSWIQDFDNAGMRGIPRSWAKRLQAAPFLFRVSDWFEFFEALGWRAHRIISNAEETTRIGRPYPLDFPFGLFMRALPRGMSQKIQSLCGAALLRKSELRPPLDGSS